MAAFCGSWRVVVLAAVLLCLAAARGTNAAVLGVDYGGEWLKLVVVKSGKPMIATVPNEMSKRKTPAMVAFSNGERLLGEEAAAIGGRYPERVYQRTRDLLGASFAEAQALLAARYLAYDLVEDAERNTVLMRTHDGTQQYTAEELAAMVLRYGADLAEHAFKLPIKDVVVTVPPFWGQRQRQALLDAAEIAGLKVMALVHEHTAAALQYGIDRKFENASQTVLLYDVGATSVRAAVEHFSAYKGKDRGRSAVIGQVAPLGVRWDHTLGGQTMEARLAEHFADEFNHKAGGGVDVRSSPKAMAKLLKAARKTKEVLSANSEAPIAVEALYGDLDFRSSITRGLFEELCGDVWGRLLAPLDAVLRDTNLTAADLDALEIIGGATRVPRLQTALADYLGSVRNVDRHLDADEAFAHGAGLHAANLSDGFKLRPFGVLDGLPYGLRYSVEGAKLTDDTTEDADESAAGGGPRSLFPPLRKLPTKIIRSLKGQDDDFGVALTYDPTTQLPPGLASQQVAHYAVKGVANATHKYQANATAPLKVALHFSLSRAGVASLDRAEVVVETLEWVAVPLPPLTPNASTNTSGNATGDSPDNGTTSNGVADEGEAEAGAAAANGTEVPRTKLKQKKRTLRIPLKVEDVSPPSLRGLSAAALAAAQERHALLRRQDEEKRTTAEAKNSLEAYILRTRTDLVEAEGVDRVSTAEERAALEHDLAEAEDWLYMEGADSNATEFQNRLATLRPVGDRIFFRLQELQHRPQMLTRARALFARARKDVAGWRESRSWVKESELSGLLEDVAAMEAWLEDKEKQQARRPLTEDPAFASADVDARAVELLKKIRRVEAIPKPKPKPKAKVNVTANNETVGDKEASGEPGGPGAGDEQEQEDGSSEDTTEQPIDGEGYEDGLGRKEELEEVEEEIDSGHDEL